MIGVLIAGNRGVIRVGLETIVRQEATIDCCGSVSITGLAERLASEQIKVLVLDLDDPTTPALPLVARLQRTSAAIVACTDTAALLPFLRRIGVPSVLTLAEAPDYLANAIRAAHAGQKYLSPAAVRAIDEGRRTLTPTEIRVAGLLAQGLGNAEIAEQMRIVYYVAQQHITALRRKLGYTERVQIARWYEQSGIGQSR
jgi:two-component system, NarL family, response regulator DevR